MQITIVQTEIEQAIIAHIKNQVTVKEGMAIDVSLRATRGDEGFQALINIYPESEKIAPATTKPAKAKTNDDQPATTKPRRPKAEAPARNIPFLVTSEETISAPAPTEDMPAASVTTIAAAVVEELPETVAEEPTVDQGSEEEPEAGEVEPDAVIETAQAAASNKLSIFTPKAATAQVEDTAPAPAERKSIFGDLKKPVNG